MSTSKALNIAIILTAYDKATRVINDTVNKSSAKLKEMKKASQDAFGAGLAFTGAGMATAAPLVEASNAAIGFEDKMADVAKVMNLVVGSAEFNKMSVEAQNLGMYLGKTGEEAAGLMASLAAGGVEAEEMEKVGKIAGEMGVAFGMASDVAGKSFIKIRNALGVTTDEAKKVGDAINYLSDSMASEADEIVNFMASGGSSVSAAFKIGGKDAAAFGSTLISVGKSSSEAATIFERMAKGIFKDEEMKDMFDKAGGGAAGFVAVLEAGAKSKDSFEFFRKFGEYGSDIALLASRTNMLKDALKGVSVETNIADSVSKEFANRNSTTQGGINRLKATFDMFTVNIGNQFLPAINEVSKVFATILKWTGELAREFPRLSKTLAFIAASASGVLLLGGAFLIVKGAFIALQVVMAANPIILTFMAIAAVAAVIIANWDLVAPMFVGVWNKIKATWQGVADWFGSLWESVKNAFDASISAVKMILFSFTPFGLIYSNWEKITFFFVRIWASVKDIFSGVVEWVKGLGPAMYQAGVDMIMGLWNGIKAMAHKPVEAVAEMADNIKGKFKNLLGIQSPSKVFMEFGRNISHGASNGVHSGLDKVKQATETLAGTAARPAKQNIYGGSSGGGVSVNYAPIINFGGGSSASDKNDFMAMLRQHSTEIMRMVREANERQLRTAF